MSSVLKAATENKTTSVTTHFKKLTTGNNVLIVSVIVQSKCHILQFLHQMFNVSAVLLDDALLKCVVTVHIWVGPINQTFFPRSPKGRCYGNRLFGAYWHTPPSLMCAGIPQHGCAR